MIYPPGWADDGVGLELVVEPWLEGLWPLLTRLQGGSDTVHPADTMTQAAAVLPPADPGLACPPSPPLEMANSQGEVPGSCSLRFSPQLAAVPLELPACPLEFLSVTWLERDPQPAAYQNGAKLPLADGPVIVARVVGNLTLSRPGAVKAYKQLCVSLGDTQVDCLPGDTVGVLCSNPTVEVEELAGLLGLTDRLDTTLAFSVMAETKKARARVPEFIPPEIRVRELLTTCLDVRAVPKKLLLRALVEHTVEVTERRRLEELCSKQVCPLSSSKDRRNIFWGMELS